MRRLKHGALRRPPVRRFREKVLVSRHFYGVTFPVAVVTFAGGRVPFHADGVTCRASRVTCGLGAVTCRFYGVTCDK